MKTVVLTGANGGLGNITLKKLLESGYFCIGIDIMDNNIEENPNLLFFKCDLTKEDEREKIINDIKNRFNRIDAIINLCGIFYMKSLVEGDDASLKRIIDINFYSMYYLNKGLFSLLNKDSKIINMSSEVAKYSPEPFMGYYSLSKRMVDYYSDCMRRECNYIGIKVIKIQSGSFNTSMLKKAQNEYDELINNTKYFKSPLSKLKYMMDRELMKTNDPIKFSKLILKILNKKHTKIRYKIKNSFKLWVMGILPEKLQDKLYKAVIK